MFKPTYTVELPEHDHHMPAQCICCGSSGIHLEEKTFVIASHSETRGIETTTRSTHVNTHVPVCDVCVRHDKESSSRWNWGCMASVPALMLGVPLVAFMIDEWKAAVVLGVLFIGPAVLLSWRSWRYSRRILREGHADTSPLAILADIEPVGPIGQRRWAFKFKSESFAQAFAEANSAKPEGDRRFVASEPEKRKRGRKKPIPD